MEDLVKAVQDLVDALRQAFELSGNLNQSIQNGPKPGGGNIPKPPPEYAGGGMVTEWGQSAILHGTPSSPEYVLPKEQLVGIVADAIRMAGAANGGSYQGGGTTVVMNHIDGRMIGKSVGKSARRRQWSTP
jgi:hypothetical protein